MTVSFDFSKQQVTAETTREYVFDLIPGAPSIVIAPAHDSNPAYLDERLRLSIEASERALREAPATPGKQVPRLKVEDLRKSIVEERDEDRRLIAKACGRDWGTAPTATDGTQPAFSEENCLAFLTALPDYLFDPFRNFAKNLYNFVERPAVSTDEAGRLGNE